MVFSTRPEPQLPPPLVERALARLGLPNRPDPDLAGLNSLYAAFSLHVPNDNIQKRIWLAGDRPAPVTGGDPVEFFINWLAHGTGGTCFPANGALCALLKVLGFDARRILGSVLMDGIEHDGNHGSVLARIEGKDYLVDAQLASFKALPLKPGRPASTGDGIHDIRAEPTAAGFDVLWHPGANREKPLTMRPDLELGDVGHEEFLARYALSASRARRRSPFNDALFIGRHFPDAILLVGRNHRTRISADNTVARREIGTSERARILVEEMGVSEEVVRALPPDEPARP